MAFKITIQGKKMEFKDSIEAAAYVNALKNNQAQSNSADRKLLPSQTSNKLSVEYIASDCIKKLDSETAEHLMSNPNPAIHHHEFGAYIRNKYLHKYIDSFTADSKSEAIIERILSHLLPSEFVLDNPLSMRLFNRIGGRFIALRQDYFSLFKEYPADYLRNLYARTLPLIEAFKSFFATRCDEDDHLETNDFYRTLLDYFYDEACNYLEHEISSKKQPSVQITIDNNVQTLNRPSNTDMLTSFDFYMRDDTLCEYRGMESIVKIPDYVKSIDRAFMHNTNITSVFIPDSVQEISDRAFNGCKNLVNVILPTFLSAIRGLTFSQCEKLQSIVIPPWVEIIHVRAFECCKQLTNIEIPDSVHTIENWAFRNCTNLQDIYLTVNIRDIGVDVFTGCKDLAIHAPIGSYAERYARSKGIRYIPT